MIRSFKDDEARSIYGRQRSPRLPAEIQQSALRKLRILNNAVSLNDLRIPPALRLARYFGTSPRFWLGLQSDYDLDAAEDLLGDRLAREVRPMAALG